MAQPSDPNVLLRSAQSFHQSGKLDKAIAIYRQLAARFPGNARLLFLLGSAESQNGNGGEAVRLLEQCLLIDPLDADAYNNLGLALETQERCDEALQSYDRAIALHPGRPESYINKGLALHKRGHLQAALESFERALERDPGNAEQHNNRGNVLLDLRRTEEALASFDRALALAPDYAEAFASRGSALQSLGRFAEALASFDRAIALDPKLAEAHNLRGDLLLAARREVEARGSFQRAYSLNPGLDFVYPRLLYSKLRTCDWTNIEAQLSKLEARILRGEQLCIPFDSLGLTGSLAVQSKAAQMYAAARFPASSALGPIPPRKRAGRIRLGYYSSEFRDHATTRLMAELFELHDRNRFELVGIDFGPAADDAMRRRVAACFDRFVDARGISDRDVARLSRDLEIDIAVDLKGFTEDARPGIFAERAAPVQVSYLGFPGTMGAGYIDYIIADEVVIPAASRLLYSERVASLPDCYQVNDRKRSIADRAFTREELGLPARGFVFCCFNNSYKITPPTFDVWMRILRQVEGSVLWLIEDSPMAAGSLRREAERRGVRAERLVFAQRMALPDHLARHRNADLFLDTLPYNAHTTASDALWVGLPVLTCPGEAFASRVAASLVSAAGLPELIARTPVEFEALAIALASDRARLEQVRAKLLANRPTAPLFDTPRFARHIEAAYAEMHERQLAGLPPDHIVVAGTRHD
jgi:predicted O-linked N-acetylglucosamine transferase (SPINDLY family)